MFREMRRKNQRMEDARSIEILEKGSYGVLALSGDDGYPYAVPMSYIYDSGKIYFHGAKEGHRFDAVCQNEKTSFCVVEQDEVVPEQYATHYRSVIAFGRIRIMEEGAEKRLAIELLADKYHPKATKEFRNHTIEAEMPALCMFVLEIEHLTGKEAKGLREERYACPCCGNYTYNMPAQKSHGFICPVCFWENDRLVKSEEDVSEANHGLTLFAARENYEKFGACAERMISYVRPPVNAEKKKA